MNSAQRLTVALVLLTMSAYAYKTVSASAGGRSKRHMPTTIGGYALGEDISDASGLKELSASEYAAFRTQNPAILSNERIFRVPSAPFQGVAWALLIGTSQGRIYKIALQNSSEPKSAAVLFHETGVTPAKWTAEGLRLTPLSSGSFRN